MIFQKEIVTISEQLGVSKSVIDKDWVLGHFIAAIFNEPELKETLIFKGGTCLKKCWFEEYRFSEDLDFTLLDNDVSNEQIFEWFNETFEYVKEEANIHLAIIDDNEHEDGGINFYISYVGPLGGFGNNKKVKVDISSSENL